MNDRQKKFVAEYLICNNATKAAVAAGYSPKTAYSIGQENLKKPEIMEALQKVQVRQAEKFEYTAEESFKNLQKIQKMALESKRLNEALKAEELKGKLCGLYVERKDISGSLDMSPFEVKIVK